MVVAAVCVRILEYLLEVVGIKVQDVRKNQKIKNMLTEFSMNIFLKKHKNLFWVLQMILRILYISTYIVKLHT